METAALDILANSNQILLAGLLSSEFADEVPVNGLVADSTDQAIPEVRRLLDDGYRAVKLKVGHSSLRDDINLVRQVSQALPERVNLRLDANQRWSLGEGLTFADGVRDCGIEYIEEPLSDPGLIDRFTEATGLPVALDESLVEANPGGFVPPEGIRALVLKPMLLGGFGVAMEFASKAIGLGLKAVISSTFESSIGVTALVHLAASLNIAETAHGLDTTRCLATDLTRRQVEVRDGRIALNALPQADEINTGLLKRYE
jgi:O-succinylbenzoate synthase